MLHDKLAEWGAQVVTDGLGLLRAGIRPPPQPQPLEGVTYANKLEKNEAHINWALSALEIADTVRAFNPWPVAETTINGERLRVHDAIAIAYDGPEKPGEVIAITRDGIDVKCGSDALRIQRMQRDGGKPISAPDYVNAHRQRQ